MQESINKKCVLQHYILEKRNYREIKKKKKKKRQQKKIAVVILYFTQCGLSYSYVFADRQVVNSVDPGSTEGAA